MLQARRRPWQDDHAGNTARHSRRKWQRHDQLLEGATGVFGDAPKADPEPVIDVKPLHAKIGELTLENDFLSGALGPRRGCCRAQEDDRSCRQAERQPSGHRSGDQPGQRLLQAPPGVGCRSEADASDRQAAHGFPVRWQTSPVLGKRMSKTGCLLWFSSKDETAANRPSWPCPSSRNCKESST